MLRKKLNPSFNPITGRLEVFKIGWGVVKRAPPPLVSQMFFQGRRLKFELCNISMYNRVSQKKHFL